MWDHIWRLTDTVISTKECLEDSFSTLADHCRRDNKNPLMIAPERAFFLTTLANRWSNEFPYGTIKTGDLGNKTAQSFARSKEVFAPPKQPKSQAIEAAMQTFKCHSAENFLSMQTAESHHGCEVMASWKPPSSFG